MIAHRKFARFALFSRITRYLRIGIAALIVQAAAVACSTPGRLPAVPAALAAKAQPEIGPDRFLVQRETETFANEGRSSFRKEQAWWASTGHQGPLPPANFLAVSGGGDNGAFGAGLLVGWSEAGGRPEFKLVTGISTGALIAPFAFLGAKYDPVLESVYTQTSQRDIFKPRNIVKGVLGDAMSDTTPLYRLLEKHVDQPLLDAIAAEYAKGRLLLIGTTNLDTPEGVVWNMTAIAASKDPRAIVLFRKILLASAAIPGVFPPVMIDVVVDGQHYQEMHVDGGAMAQVFLYPPSLRVAEESAKAGIERQRTLYVIRNARLDFEPADVKRSTLPIATRAVSSLMKTQGMGDLYRIYLTAQRDGLDFNLAFIPSTFNAPHTKQFDTEYMRQLFKTGHDMAATGYPWQKYPPGYTSAQSGGR